MGEGVASSTNPQGGWKDGDIPFPDRYLDRISSSFRIPQGGDHDLCGEVAILFHVCSGIEDSDPLPLSRTIDPSIRIGGGVLIGRSTEVIAEFNAGISLRVFFFQGRPSRRSWQLAKFAFREANRVSN